MPKLESLLKLSLQTACCHAGTDYKSSLGFVICYLAKDFLHPYYATSLPAWQPAFPGGAITSTSQLSPITYLTFRVAFIHCLLFSLTYSYLLAQPQQHYACPEKICFSLCGELVLKVAVPLAQPLQWKFLHVVHFTPDKFAPSGTSCAGHARSVRSGREAISDFWHSHFSLGLISE